MNLIKKITSDNTILYIFETNDGNRIEAVYSKPHKGLCVSSQIGCPVGCVFCASNYRFIRNLREDEINEQLEYVTKEQGHLQSFHFGGTGEPLLNMNAVVKIFNKWSGVCEDAFLTTSVPNINLLSEILNYPFKKIFISMHSLDSITRHELMPHSLPPDNISAYLSSMVRNHADKPEIFIGYLLLSGINDSEENISELIKFCQLTSLPAYLMVYNKIEKNSKLYTNLSRLESIIELFKDKNILYSVSSPARQDKIGGCGTLKVNRNILEL